MEEKYGVPWVRIQLLRPVRKIEASLREIAGLFDDKIKEGAERVIANTSR